jgi:hypothetical protein
MPNSLDFSQSVKVVFVVEYNKLLVEVYLLLIEKHLYNKARVQALINPKQLLRTELLPDCFKNV